MVSVDTVYQKVLAFANKEQRGYITPQEFNLFAHQAQMEIFEQYFYDINQFRRVPGNDTKYADVLTILDEKVSIFDDYGVQVDFSGSDGNIVEYADFLTNKSVYRLSQVHIVYNHASLSAVETISGRAEELRDALHYMMSPLTTATKKRPLYQRTNISGEKALKIWPSPDSSKDRVYASYIRNPKKPNWGYVVVNDKPLYNSSTSQDFELHPSEETELVYRILVYTGIAIEKPQLTQAAAGLGVANIQQEKA